MRMAGFTALCCGLSLGSLGLLACAAPGQVGVKTPQQRGSDYPPAFEATAAQQQEAETAWRALLTEFQLPETQFDAEPVLNTPRALPLALAGRIKLSPQESPLDELAAKEALRRFIERYAVLLSGGRRESAASLKDLSLMTFSKEGSLYRAVYQQRSFPYPLANGFGELMLVISKTGTLLQWNSRLLPKLELPVRTLIAAKDLPGKFVGRAFSYSSFAGQPMSYKVAKPDEVRVKDLVVYPKQSGNRLSLHLAYPVEVGSGMTWTVYVDAVTGEELEVRQNFNT
ncbi:MAG: PepSY domain-containing protein [Acidobacteria bacterium]|nr:PepSY domain-containing protein [Acidobacteriota bacterium]